MAAGSPPRTTGALPPQASGFVGREAELTQVHELLRRSRLVTITGAGGVGKTRLAVRAADAACGRFSDGVHFAGLSELRDPGLVAATVAAQLLAPPWATAGLDSLHGRQLLLILDTCEHLVDGCAALADTLLREAPGVTILATSRQPLDAAGEATLVLDPLPVPEPGSGTAGTADAVELFAQRAAAVLPGFTVTPDNLADVITVCDRLDGIPLAIELAAVRLRALPLHQMAARIDDRLRLLTGGRRSGPPRHQTLRASVGWSYALCTPAEQLLWARLSVFAGGFDIAAAEEVCAGGTLTPAEVVPAIIGLVDKSVLARCDPPDAGHAGDPGYAGGGAETSDAAPAGLRFRLPGTLREFGAERLRDRPGASVNPAAGSAGDGAATAIAASGPAGAADPAIVAAAVPAMVPVPPTAPVVPALRAPAPRAAGGRGGYRGAGHRGSGQPGTGGRGRSGPGSRARETQGHGGGAADPGPAEAAVRRRFIACYLALAERFEQAPAAEVPGQYRRLLGEHANLRAAFDDALRLPGNDGAAIVMATSLFAYWRVSGQLREAEYWLDRALDRCPQRSAAGARVRATRGYIRVLLGDLDGGRRDAQSAVALAATFGDMAAAGRGYSALHRALGYGGNLIEARDAAASAAGCLTAVGDVAGLAQLDAADALLRLQAGEPDRCCESAARGLARLPAGEAWCAGQLYGLLALGRFLQGDIDRAKPPALKALELQHQAGDVTGMAFGLGTVAFIAAGEAQYARAAWFLGASAPLWERAGRWYGGAPALESLHQVTERVARAGLGDDQFWRLRAAGGASPPEQAIKRALSDIDPY